MSVNHTHHSLLKIAFASTICLVMVAALGVAVMFSRAPQSVDSQASVKKGIVTVNLSNTTTTNVVNQPVSMLVMIDTKQALISNASLGIRFQGSHVKDIKYTPAPTDIFNLTQQLVSSGASDSGINLSMMSATGKSKAFPTGYVLGTLSFVPTAAGPLNIYFDPNVSHVYQPVSSSSPTPTPKPTMMPPVTARPVPSYAPGTELPHTQTQQTIIIGDPQPSARPMIDILQTPENVSLMIMSGMPTTAPTPSPVISCDSMGKCPPGYSCVQPTMPPCPAGMMCPQVMPARQCVPMMPSVRPTSYPTPRPTSMPTYRPTPYPSSKPTSYPTPRPTAYPAPSYRPYSPVPYNR